MPLIDSLPLEDASIQVDRAAYKAECVRRWHGDPLRDALANWKQWSELHEELVSSMLAFKRNPGLVDLAGKWHADGSLTDFVWKMQAARQPNQGRLDPFLDFCDHYQRIFLRRGLIIYCTQVLRGIEAAALPETANAEP